MAGGVAGHVKDLGGFRANGERVAFGQGAGQGGQAVGVGLCPQNRGSGGGDKFGHALDMVGMVVGQQDLVQMPAPGGKGVQNRGGFGHVNKGCVARGCVVQ